MCIVGANGAGKTTLMGVMLGLYRPQRGQVIADGVQLADLDLVDLRHQIGVVLQDVVLFGGTIRENLTLSGRDADDDALCGALRAAVADEFVDRMALGIDTPLGDAGSGLSGGERQRIAIARAVLAHPSLIVLDEPTAHIAPDTTGRIVENLTRLPWRPSVVIITHDRSVAARAGRIALLRDGRTAPTTPIVTHERVPQSGPQPQRRRGAVSPPAPEPGLRDARGGGA